MKVKNLLSMILVAGMMLVGCQNDGQDVDQSTENPQPDQAVQEETLVEEVKVVSATVSATNVLAKLDAEVVGVPTTTQTLPAQYADLPEVGQAMSPDLEIVASLEPDLFIMDSNFQASVEESLSQYGLNTFFFETGSYSDFVNSIKQLGVEINREDEAKKLVSEIEASVTKALEKKGDQSPTVAVIFGAGENFMLATDTSYLGDLVKTLGATNITSKLDGDMSSGYVQFSLEQILAENPDYVLRFAHGNIEQTKKMFDEAFDANDAYQELDAVKSGKVYDLDPSVFNVSANLEITTAIETLGEIFYGN
ncbi:ABC transporter substrate-binding protein [Turicibacter bilis]|uniref:ABC transporter substrate-binding protein n=1 Tax=Turicibacter bilis TaxID=2735723 RepID=A0A9Q9CM04_9FIRM|nr:helical backbone metal receptor [Turicibacter bilis]MBS3198813.1 ABC transporter substrate-binding protein [Turicibacter bilis]MBS3200755.1 ABC transporter substrate-binding protein [Turicibacter bilis]UUF05594.1 ABC transporter substrate-binding protein [Turicibacter bilis]UUF08949.1 ABC transporter substrate-binding protein [Turicibacter bilis]